jgi:hypothetical protein
MIASASPDLSGADMLMLSGWLEFRPCAFSHAEVNDFAAHFIGYFTGHNASVTATMISFVAEKASMVRMENMDRFSQIRLRFIGAHMSFKYLLKPLLVSRPGGIPSLLGIAQSP